jgi:hypothetical protein
MDWFSNMVTPIGNIGAEQPLKIKQGSTFSFRVTLKNADPPKGDGLAINLTGKTLSAHLRKTPFTATIAAVFACNVVTAASGIFDLVLTDEQTAALTCGEFIDDETSLYVWDLELADSVAGTVRPLLYGDVQVFREITRPEGL